MTAVLLAATLALGLHVNLSASSPRGLSRRVAEAPTRGAGVVVCVSSESAEFALTGGWLGPGPWPGGVQPLLKRVVAVAGDLVEIDPRR
jgi:type IV secretory pathway protease TraF